MLLVPWGWAVLWSCGQGLSPGGRLASLRPRCPLPHAKRPYSSYSSLPRTAAAQSKRRGRRPRKGSGASLSTGNDNTPAVGVLAHSLTHSLNSPMQITNFLGLPTLRWQSLGGRMGNGPSSKSTSILFLQIRLCAIPTTDALLHPGQPDGQPGDEPVNLGRRVGGVQTDAYALGAARHGRIYDGPDEKAAGLQEVG